MNPTPPPKPTYPTRWIPLGLLALALIPTGFVFQQPLLSLTPTGVGLLGTLLLLVTAYQFLAHYADFDHYYWWHGPVNPEWRRRNRRK
ncbi:MAG: hypothetical protein ACTHN5_15400 [Phycisphaerae bacterium]